MISYLVVAFKDPGYVTGYFLSGNDFEDDIELAKREGIDKNKFNDLISNKKKQTHKIKKVFLSYSTLSQFCQLRART